MLPLSVIIVSYNTRAMTLDCLRHLHTVVDGERVEIWLVDNASTDGSVEAVRAEFPDVQVLANEDNVGFGAANNQAMERATGQFLLLLNSDAFPETGAIQAMMSHLQAHPATALVAPRLLNDDGSVQASVHEPPTVARFWKHTLGVSRFFPQSLDEAALLKREPFFKGACLLVRREAYEKVGGFDPDFFFYMEEAEWQARLHAAGYDLDFLPAARVVHLAGGSGGNPFRFQLLLVVASDTYLWKRVSRIAWLFYRLGLLLWCGRKLVQPTRAAGDADRQVARWILFRPFASPREWQKAVRTSPHGAARLCE